jgi:LacI family transcriptional regulator
MTQSQQRVTLTDVALRAGVSRTTASFVTTGRTDMRISAGSQERVRQAARELNYRPSLIARNRRTNNSQTIAVLSDGVAADAMAGEVIRGALTSALRHEHMLFVAETAGDATLEKRLIQNMIDREVGGFVYVSMYTRRARISAVLRAQPLVLVNCVARANTVTSVIPNEREAGRSAIRALLRHGHREKIVLVGENTSHVVAAVERITGVTDVLEALGLTLFGSIPTAWWPDPARLAVAQYLAQGHRPSAFVCLNDRIAMGAYQACQGAGLTVPQDVSIVSFDDSELAGWLQPGLTSVAIPHFEMGRRAIEMLLSDPGPPRTHLVPMKLIDRESIAEPPPSRRRRNGDGGRRVSAGPRE